MTKTQYCLPKFWKKSKMISAKKLIKMARKWQKRAASGRKRISFPRIDSRSQDLDECSTSSDISLSNGHFVVYTIDRRRFVLPLSHLNNYIFAELLRMSEEEFGLPSNGPITLPCDAVFMEYILLIIRRGISKDLAKALVSSVTSCSVLSAVHQESSSSQLLVPYAESKAKVFIPQLHAFGSSPDIGAQALKNAKDVDIVYEANSEVKWLGDSITFLTSMVISPTQFGDCWRRMPSPVSIPHLYLVDPLILEAHALKNAQVVDVSAY
ncbi:LOW QUALITY PROTEIN: Small auxin-up RNA [Dillenia turbinata]|uniref:Small auxin-up RNA n=1 Tax=Dillenia turbinata TaxID=194707 RepID=A0AAN8UY05_9MAGN